MDAEQSPLRGTDEPSSTPSAVPLANTGVRTPRWGLGAFLLVELLYLLVSLAFVPLFVNPATPS